MVFISLLLSKNEHGILFVTTGEYELACTYNASKTRVYLLENLIKGKDIDYVKKKKNRRKGIIMKIYLHLTERRFPAKFTINSLANLRYMKI